MQAGFAYEDRDAAGVPTHPATHPARLPLSVSIFADRAHERAQLREDVVGAGLRAGHCGELAVIFGSDPIALGDVVLLDCPVADGATIAALARLDMRIARAGAQLVVSTEIDALDDVFGCLDQSGAQILVAPTRAERMVAIGRVLGRLSAPRLRELPEEDRVALLRLTEQVEQIARQIGGIASRAGGASSAGSAQGGSAPAGAGAVTPDLSQDSVFAPTDVPRGGKPALPDPRLVRRIIRQRQLRARFFDGALFADPAWDMLLDLAAARAEHLRVSVSSLCIASNVPPTTALRWIGQLSESGLIERQDDVTDRRRAFIALSDAGSDAMARYFAELGRGAASLV